jgi:hypothetical protein
MANSKMIAGLIGPFMLVLGLTVLLNVNLLPDIVAGFVRDPAMVILVGFAVFLPGLAIVRFHNHWKGGWRVLVTIVGWFYLVIGLIRILFPAQISQIATQAIQIPGLLPSLALIFLAVGGFLTFQAYRR